MRWCLVAALLVGCGAHAEDAPATLGQDGADASEIETRTSSLTAAFTLAPMANPARDIASVVAAAAQAPAYFTPGCMTASGDGANRLTFVLDGCTGPWGLARVSGTVVATYDVATAADGTTTLSVDVSSDALHLDRATARYHATASVIANGLAREMKWTGDLDGTTARGRALARTATWDAKWNVGESCMTLGGSTSGEVGARGFSTTVSGYVRCKHECPRAGDVTVVERATGRTIEIEYTGANEIVVRDGTTTYDVTLACVP